ncbi:MAG: HDIG domain-containing protein [Acidobacteriota bacterium]|nr:HDIG domain-containing protein [Acidobacteriota bacterium]MDH3522974.1 HDIG domain-containing protein [Acidobacteriota bacterium]
MDRETAFDLMTRHVAAPGLRRHMVAVEAAMGHYAGRLGGDVERWRLAGLLHDFDWEIHPTLEDHPAKGAPILREHGCPEDVVHAVLAHNTAGTGVEREAAMDFALLACDEVTGLIVAAALVRPSKDVRDVRLKSLRKRWKERSFAAGVHRDEVEEATREFSAACFDGRLELWDHVENVLVAMQGAAGDLDLDGRLAS